MMRLLVLSFSIAAVTTGCLISGTAEPRYFTPILSGASATAAPATSEAPVQRSRLRLGRVTGARHLKERMVWRRSEVEFAFRELSRWTQPPQHFVEQAVATELFERRGFRRSTSGAVPNLDVHVRAFEEDVRDDPGAIVEISVLLVDGRRNSLLERTLIAKHPVDGSDPAGVARAMGAALEDVVGQLADAVVAALP